MSALKVGTCGLRGCHTNDNAHALYFCPPFGLIPFLPLEDIVFARVSVKVPRMTETLQAASRINHRPKRLSFVRTIRLLFPTGRRKIPRGCYSRCSHLIESTCRTTRFATQKGKTQSHHDVVVVVWKTTLSTKTNAMRVDSNCAAKVDDNEKMQKRGCESSSSSSSSRRLAC